MSRLSSSMRVAVIVSVGLTLPCAAQAGEPSLHGTIFDSNAQNLIKMDAATRKKVDHVMAQSDAKLQAVFNKYGINPKGEQHMVKLMEASSDLESVGHWEKAQMQKILSPAQMAHYEKITAATTERVRKAVE